MSLDRQLIWFFTGVVTLLTVATLVAWVLGRRPGDERWQATVANLKARIWAWWVMVAIFAVAISGRKTALVLFALISFFALRESSPPSRCSTGSSRPTGTGSSAC